MIPKKLRRLKRSIEAPQVIDRGASTGKTRLCAGYFFFAEKTSCKGKKINLQNKLFKLILARNQVRKVFSVQTT